MRDVKQAFRFIRTHPSFAVLVILCLALGIGVNSAIFSLVNSVLLRPLPYPDPERLFMLLEVTEVDGAPEDYGPSFQSFASWRAQTEVFERVEAMEATFRNLTGVSTPERIAVALVTDGFFDLLGARPVLGRTFTAEETRAGGPPTVILGHAYWLRRFGGDRGAIGRSLVLDGQSHTVVGVLGPRLYFQQDAELWLPMPVDPANPPYPPSVRYLYVPARLAPGMSAEQGQAEMDAIAGRLAQEFPDTNRSWGVRVVPLREHLVGDLRRALTLLLAAVGFVLLIACANVGNLLLTRAVGLRDEMALRLALGARRRQLVQQMVVESVILALIGGAVGLALAAGILQVLPAVSPVGVALLRDVRIDLPVLAFTALVSLLTGLFPGLLAALRGGSSQSRLQSVGRRSTEGVQGRRLQGALVVAEVALALALLVCAGLMIKGFHRLNATSPGFDPDNVLMAQISLPDWKYSEPDQIRAFWRDLLPRVQSLPGVVNAGTTHALPVNSLALTTAIEVEGRIPATPDERLAMNFRKVSPGYFATLRIPLVNGRFFTDRDDGNAPPVAVVSQELASRLWPQQDPIGKQIRRRRKTDNPWMTVVGVAGDVQDGIPGSPPASTFYIPLQQDPKSSNPTVHLLVRTSVTPESLASAVRQAVLAVDADQPIDRVSTMAEWVASSLSKRRFNALMLGVFGGLGIVLATIGIYGVLSHSVSRRRHEMGVRMALGAQVGDVVRMVLRQGMMLTAAGLGLGLVLALLVTRLFASVLAEVEPGDPVTLLGITLGLAAVAALASYLPARRAGRSDPLVSLKHE